MPASSQSDERPEGAPQRYASDIDVSPPRGKRAGGGSSRCPECLRFLYEYAVDIVHTVMPPGGVLSSAFNMASSSIGAGILGLAGATDSCGLLLAFIYLVIITALSVYSMRILAITADKTRIRSFEGLSRWLFPHRNYAFSYFAAFIRWFHAFSANVAYVISMGNSLKPIITEAHRRQPDNSALQYLDTRNGNRLLTVVVWFAVMLPLAIPKHIDSLRYASAFAVSFMVYFVIIIVIHSCMNGLQENVKHVRITDAGGYDPATDPNAVFLFRSGNSVVNSVGVFVFAYVCQINALEIHSDMPPGVRTTSNYTWAAFIGMLLCGTLYLLVCIFGYFDFGSKYLLNQSILLMYNPLDEPAVLIAYIGVMCKLCVAYALLTIATRNSVYYMIGWQEKYAGRAERAAMAQVVNMREREMEEERMRAQRGGAREDNDNDNDDDDVAGTTKPLRSVPEGEQYFAEPGALDDDVEVTGAQKQQPTDLDGVAGSDTTEDDDTYIDNIPYWKHLIVVLTLSVASLLCGLFIPSINMVFGFAGAISGGFMAFVFPAMFFMYSGNWTLKAVGFWDYFLTYVLLISGIIGIIFGTGGTIYNTI